MSALFSTIASGNAFKNPFDSGFSSLKSQVEMLDLTNPASPILADLTPSQITSITQSFSDMMENMDGFMNHTDNMSGVNLNADIGFSKVSQVMSVARVASGQQTCSEFNKAFGSIMKAAEIINQARDLEKQIERLLTHPEEAVAEIIARANALKQRMADQMAADILAFEQGMATALANAVSESIVSLLGDGCFANVVGAVATDEMMKKINEIKAPKL